MNRLMTVFLLVLPIVVVACTSPVVPTVTPTASPTLEQLPTATIEPTRQPSPTPPQIPVPYTTITSTHVVILTVTEITGTISTRDKAAIVWLADGVRHFGILDVDKASVSQLPFSIEDNYKQSGDLVWSPIGTAFIYEQHQLDNIGIHYNHDIFGISVANSNDGRMLEKDVGNFRACTWSPDGLYVSCVYFRPHASSGLCVMVFDAHASKWLCDRCWVHFDASNSYCAALPLSDGKLWYTADELEPAKKSVPEPTEVIHGAVQAALTQFCWPSKSDSRCVALSSPNHHFITYGLWLDEPPYHDVILDEEQSQVWKIGDGTQFWGWSVDSRYFSWIEDDQMHLFDTINHTVTIYVIADAKMLNVAWSPAK